MRNPVEGLLEVYEDMAEVLLALEIFFTKDSQVEDLLCGAPSCSEACVFFSNYRLRFRLLSAQYDLHHHFAWVADRSVVLILLHVAFLEKCVDQELGPQGWPFSCLPDLVADYRKNSCYFFSTCLDQFCLDVVNSS